MATVNYGEASVLPEGYIECSKENGKCNFLDKSPKVLYRTHAQIG